VDDDDDDIRDEGEEEDIEATDSARDGITAKVQFMVTKHKREQKQTPLKHQKLLLRSA